MEEKIQLGASVVDTITGMTGTVIARADYLHGSSRLEVQPEGLKDGGEMVESKWIEEKRLSLGR